MKMYVIEYQRTGTTATMEKKNRGQVTIFSSDLLRDNFDQLFKEFEYISSEIWHTYETRDAITNISISEIR